MDLISRVLPMLVLVPIAVIVVLAISIRITHPRLSVGGSCFYLRCQ